MDQTAPTFLLTLLDGEDPHRNAEMDVPERGAAIAGRYVVRSRLGSGGFGEVWVARDRVRGEDVAVKLVGGEHDQERRRARREVNALRWLRLPGVVRMHDEGRWNGAWFIVMDLIDGQNWAPLDRTIDNQVARLRKKVERDPARPQLIKTVRGVGYVLTESPAESAD